jgi:hypothetical protein
MTRDVVTFTGASPRQLLNSAPHSAVSSLFLFNSEELAYGELGLAPA